MPRLAANLSTMFREWDFLDRFDAAAEAGFALVECQFPYEAPADAIAARLARNGLAMAMFNTPPGDALGFAALPGGFAEMQASVETAIGYARALDAGRIHLLAGRVAPGPESDAAYRRSLAWAADRLATEGLALLIEPVNAIDNPDYFLTGFDQAEAVIRDLDLPNVGLQFDLYHCRMSGLDVADALARLRPLVRHVQVSSVPGRGEPDADDIAILSSLDALGYDGVVGCEYVPRAGTLAGLGWRESL